MSVAIVNYKGAVLVLSLYCALYNAAIADDNKNIIKYGGTCISWVKIKYLLLAEQAPVSGHLSPTPLVAAFQNYSRKRPAPVSDTFFASRVCPFTRALTVLKCSLCQPGEKAVLEVHVSFSVRYVLAKAYRMKCSFLVIL